MAENLNIEPLVFEIENVIRKGVNKILKDYINRTTILENTHKQILSVLNDLNNGDYETHNYKSEEDDSIFFTIKEMTKELVCQEVKKVEEFVYNLENKFDKLEKNHNSMFELFDKISNSIQKLNEDIQSLKNSNSEVNSKEDLHNLSIQNVIKPSLISACENENIKFEINENYEEEKTPELELLNFVSGNESEEELEKESEKDSEEELEEDKDIDDEIETEKSESEEENEDDMKEEEIKSELEEVNDEEAEVNDEEAEVNEEEEAEVNEEEEEVNEEEEELFEIEIDEVTYCTNNDENGFIYELTEDGDVGGKIGYLKDSEPFFYADEK